MATSLRWPAGLPQSIPATASLSQEENVLRTDTDMGPAKTRRRYTAFVRLIDVASGLVLDTEQLEELMHFYDVTTQCGALSFMWLNPVEESGDLEMRFRGIPQISFAVPGRREIRQHRVALVFEILP